MAAQEHFGGTNSTFDRQPQLQDGAAHASKRDRTRWGTSKMFLDILYPAIRERDRLEASAACLRARLRETTGLL